MDDGDLLIRKIVGCAMKVHRYLRNGFQERIYGNALAVEMNIQKINFVKEKEMRIVYEGCEVGIRRVDFFVEGNVMVEIKAVETLEGAHLAQALNYLEIYNIENGILINFGSKSLQFKRLYNNKYKKIVINNFFNK